MARPDPPPPAPADPASADPGNGEGAPADGSASARERTFRLVLEYDGRDFEGWQVQAGARPARTVQGVLAEAVASVTGSAGRLRGAGRTDAGVHALGQVASLAVATRLEPTPLARALNARLPRDVAVLDCRSVPAGWDALRAARGKHYRYRIWNGPTRSPLRAARWHHVREALDVDAMRAAAAHLVGTHDFAAFQAAGSSVRTTVRRLRRATITGEAGGELVLDLEGEGFLRHMVRNLAGTLIEVGRGRWAPERITAILASRDRAEAGPTAPALGLELVAVQDDWSTAGSDDPSVDPGSASGRSSVDAGDPVG